MAIPMNFLFYDLETSGLSKSYDQIFQFAAIRCDENLNQLGVPTNLFCKPRNDVFPSPEAILANQLDIKKCNREGLDELKFALAVQSVLESPTTYITGYNSKRFDDELIRYLFYRNLMDPYRWGWAEGNKRIDVMDHVLLAYAFGRDVGLQFPVVDGQASLKLEHIAEENRFEARNHHDALNDTKNTKSIMEIIRSQRPQLFDFALGLVEEEVTKNRILDSDLLYHVGTRYGYLNRCVSVQKFLCFHPRIGKRLLTWNLTHDPLVIIEKTPQEISQNLYLLKGQKAFEIGFNEIALNKSPIVLECEMKKTGLPIDLNLISENLEKLKSVEPELKNLAHQTYGIQELPTPKDVDASLYDQYFFADRNKHAQLTDKILQDPPSFSTHEIQNRRYSELLLRLQGRNFYEQMDEASREEYNAYRREKLLCKEDVEWMTHNRFQFKVSEYQRNQKLSSEQEYLLSNLCKHVESIVQEIS